jgi:hypothetical protein
MKPGLRPNAAFLLLAPLLALPFQAHADSAVSASYLLRGTTAQQDALGGGALPAYGFAAAQWSNPAALGGAGPLGLDLSAVLQPASGGTTEYLSGQAALDDEQVQHLGMQGYYSSLGDTYRSSDGVGGGDFSDTESLSGLSYAYDLGSVSIGVGGKFLGETLAGTSAQTGLLADLGILARLDGDSFLMSLALRDLGKPPSWTGSDTPAPTTLELGFRESISGDWQFHLYENGGVLDPIGDSQAQANWFYGAGVEMHMDTEYPIDLRVGYAGESANPAPPYGLSAGFGISGYGLELDYAFTDLGDLGSSQRLGLTWRSGGGAAAQDDPVKTAPSDDPDAPDDKSSGDDDGDALKPAAPSQACTPATDLKVFGS